MAGKRGRPRKIRPGTPEIIGIIPVEKGGPEPEKKTAPNLEINDDLPIRPYHYKSKEEKEHIELERQRKLNEPPVPIIPTGVFPRGRNEIISEEVIRKAEQAAKLGLDWETVCQYAGIGKSTFYRYKRQGQIDQANHIQSIYRDLLEALNNAKAEWEVSNLARITKAAIGGAETQDTITVYDNEGRIKNRTVTSRQIPSQWTASAWLLERREPEKYGRRVEFDWRKPAVRSGLDPDSIKGRVVGLILDAIGEGNGLADSGSDGGSPASQSLQLPEVSEVPDEA